MKPPTQPGGKNKTRIGNLRREQQFYEGMGEQNQNPNMMMQPGGLRPRRQTNSKGPPVYRVNQSGGQGFNMGAGMRRSKVVGN